jgi:2-enoate reductase
LGEAVHSLGAKIFIQLTAGFGRVARADKFLGQPVSASAIPNYWDPTVMCRSISTSEVEGIVAAFGDAAELVARAGMDGIELHGHEGYIFDQFTTAIWNRREDRYGGGLAERLTFPIEVLNEIKRRAGRDFPVTYRFGLKHYIKGLHSGALKGEEFEEAGRDVAEGLEMAALLEKAGFDALHVDAGCYDSWYWAHPPLYQEHGCMVDMAAAVKAVVKVPVIAVGRLDVPQVAEGVIEEHKADIVALGRGLLADPNWPIKVREGRTEDIRPCLGCHDGCFGRFMTYRPLSCTVNPAVGRERHYHAAPAEHRKRILIAGGGVAGMEAARVAAGRGHSVVLYERDERLGGHVREAAVPGFKKDLERLLDWYELQLRHCNVGVRCNTEVSAASIQKEGGDVVILATGSDPIIPDLPGINMPQVVTCIDLLVGKKRAEGAVAVIGGGLMGCETALWLAQQGRTVSVVEKLPALMSAGLHVPRMNRLMLLDLLAAKGVRVLVDRGLKEITDEGVLVSSGTPSGERMLKADTVVMAVGMKPRRSLHEALAGSIPRLYVLGDCREPGNVMGAIWDGHEVGRAL